MNYKVVAIVTVDDAECSPPYHSCKQEEIIRATLIRAALMILFSQCRQLLFTADCRAQYP